MQITNDEVNILLTILDGLHFKLKDAHKVDELYQKLNAHKNSQPTRQEVEHGRAN